MKLLAIGYYITTSGCSVCVAAGTIVLILQQAFPKLWQKLKCISSSCQARRNLRNKDGIFGGSIEQERPFGDLGVEWIIVFTQNSGCTVWNNQFAAITKEWAMTQKSLTEQCKNRIPINTKRICLISNVNAKQRQEV